MRQIFVAAIAAAALPLGTSMALAQTAPAKAANTEIGNVLVDAQKGLTLYILDRDTTPGKSTCNDQCATNWPPLMASADAKPVGDYTIAARDDGSKQWAYKGKPLYTWSKDKKPGDKTGDGFNSVWHVAKP